MEQSADVSLGEICVPTGTAADWPLTRHDKFQMLLDVFERELQMKDEELRRQDDEIADLKQRLAEAEARPGAAVEAAVDLSQQLGRPAPPCQLRGTPDQIAAVLAALVAPAAVPPPPPATRRSSCVSVAESMYTVRSALSEESESCLSTPRTPRPPERRVSFAAVSRPGLDLDEALHRRSSRPQALAVPCVLPARDPPQALATPAVVSSTGDQPQSLGVPRRLCLGASPETPAAPDASSASPRTLSRVYTLLTPGGSRKKLLGMPQTTWTYFEAPDDADVPLPSCVRADVAPSP